MTLSDIARRHTDRLILSAIGPVKRCTRCREFWPMDAEFFHPHGPGKFHSHCKACRFEQRSAA